ncbi:hypothetical protein [Nocardia rhamnosiphila]|uniref:hypothetical protein n=1 Tax=Nocardia rhamnosiphila TaxID=426716 RepID=UPI001B3C7775|nr:hypothetical protein [Nocardia rhamnosiphila]
MAGRPDDLAAGVREQLWAALDIVAELCSFSFHADTAWILFGHIAETLSKIAPRLPDLAAVAGASVRLTEAIRGADGRESTTADKLGRLLRTLSSSEYGGLLSAALFELAYVDDPSPPQWSPAAAREQLPLAYRNLRNGEFHEPSLIVADVQDIGPRDPDEKYVVGPDGGDYIVAPGAATESLRLLHRRTIGYERARRGVTHNLAVATADYVEELVRAGRRNLTGSAGIATGFDQLAAAAEALRHTAERRPDHPLLAEAAAALGRFQEQLTAADAARIGELAAQLTGNTPVHYAITEALITLRIIGCVSHAATTLWAYGSDNTVIPADHLTDPDTAEEAIQGRLRPVGDTDPIAAIKEKLLARDGNTAVVAAADTVEAHLWVITNIAGHLFVTDPLIEQEPGIPRTLPIDDWEPAYNPAIDKFFAAYFTAETGSLTAQPGHTLDTAQTAGLPRKFDGPPGAEAAPAPYSAVHLNNRVLGSASVARDMQPPAAPEPAREGSAARPPRGGGAAAGLPPEHLSLDDPGGHGLDDTRAGKDRSGRWRTGGLDPSVVYVDTPGKSEASGVRKRSTGGRTEDGGRSATATGPDSGRIGAKPAASPDDGAPNDRRPSENRTHIVKTHVAQGNPEPALDMLRTWPGEKLYRWLSRRYGASPLAREIVDEAIERAIDTVHRMPDDLDIEQWIVAKARERIPQYDMFVEFRRRLVQLVTGVNDLLSVDDPDADSAQLAQILGQATAAQMQRALRSERLNDTQRALLNTVRTMPRSPGTETTETGNRPSRQMELLAATRILARQLRVDMGLGEFSERAGEEADEEDAALDFSRGRQMGAGILRLLAEGHTRTGIAADSRWSLGWLKVHCADLANEFGTPNRGPVLVATGIRRGLIDKPEQSPLALTPSEREVLTAKAYGMTDRQVADETGRSLRFVTTTVALLRRDTQSRTTAQLVARTIDQLDFVVVDSGIYKLLGKLTDERIAKILNITEPALLGYYSELVRRLNINYHRALAQFAAERMETNTTDTAAAAKPKLPRELLNDREAGLLSFYKLGKSPERCAEIMGLSVKAIDNYTREIANRLGFKHRDAILRRGIRLGIVEEPADIDVRPRLSEQEIRVVTARAQNMTYAETAEQLDISVDSVSETVRDIFYKIAAKKWQEVFDFAVAEGIIQEAPEEKLWRNVLLLLAAGHTIPRAAAAMDRSHDWLLDRLPALATRLRTVVDDTVAMWTESHSTALVTDGIRRGLIDALPQFPMVLAPVDRAILAAKSQGRTTEQTAAAVNLSPSQTRLRLARLRDATHCATTTQLIAKTIHQLDADTTAARHTELMRILAMIATGHGRQDIANEFDRSLSWVNIRLTALSQTFGVSDHQAALAAAAIRAGILAPTPITTELSLGAQERRIILLKAEGKSDRAIAIELQVPSKVVRSAVARLRNATDSSTIAHLIAKTIDAVDADSTPSAEVPGTATDEIIRAGAETGNGRIERFLTATVFAMNRNTARRNATRTRGRGAGPGRRQCAVPTGSAVSRRRGRFPAHTSRHRPTTVPHRRRPSLASRRDPHRGAGLHSAYRMVEIRAVGRRDHPPPEIPTAQSVPGRVGFRPPTRTTHPSPAGRMRTSPCSGRWVR